MSGAQWMAIYILVAFAVFVVWDIWYYKADKRTLSQWVIRQAQRKWLYWALATAFCLFLWLGAAWLFWHWQLYDLPNL